MAKRKKINNDLQNITQKTKDLAIWTPLRTGVYFCWSEIQDGLHMRTNFNIGPPYGKKCFEILFLRTSELFRGKLSWVFIMIVFYKIYWIFDIFLLIALSDVVSINEMTLILEIIGWFEVKHIMMLPVKTMTLVLKVSTYITTSITARPIRLAAILVIMSISTLKWTVILYVFFLYSWYS